MLSAALLVNRFGFHQSLGVGGYGTFGVEVAEKAVLVAFMASCADLFHLDQQRVPITIEGDAFDALDVSAGFAFHPEFLTGAAPKVSALGLEGFQEGITVHPGHHQHFAGGLFLDNGGYKSIRIESEFFEKCRVHVDKKASRLCGSRRIIIAGLEWGMGGMEILFFRWVFR